MALIDGKLTCTAPRGQPNHARTPWHAGPPDPNGLVRIYDVNDREILVCEATIGAHIVACVNQPPIPADSMAFSWVGDADIERYLTIPRGYTVDINGDGYTVANVGSEGIEVWPFDEQHSTPTDEMLAARTDEPTVFTWDEIQTLHIC